MCGSERCSRCCSPPCCTPPGRAFRGCWRAADGARQRAWRWRCCVAAGHALQYVQWAVGRSYKNYAASVELGRRLPPGTLVHGKLANGLSLENRIRPDLRRPRIRQLRRPEDARRCAIYSDLHRAVARLRVAGARSGHPGRDRRISRPPHHHDVRRGRDRHGPRSRRAHRQVRRGPDGHGTSGRAKD